MFEDIVSSPYHKHKACCFVLVGRQIPPPPPIYANVLDQHAKQLPALDLRIASSPAASALALR